MVFCIGRERKRMSDGSVVVSVGNVNNEALPVAEEREGDAVAVPVGKTGAKRRGRRKGV